MKTYVIIGRDSADGRALRKQHRPAHLAHMESLSSEGRVRYAGPLLSDEDGGPLGSVIVIDAVSALPARSDATARMS